jgi:hypothetical protein
LGKQVLARAGVPLFSALIIACACTPTGQGETTLTTGPTSTTVTTSTTPVATTTTVTEPTTVPRSTTTVAPVPEFDSSVSAVTAVDLYASWREGCPLGVEELRAVDVTHWGFDGTAQTGRLIVSAGLTEEVVGIMSDLFEAGFPIERMEPIDVYEGDDDLSMAANNTSAFNCRTITGGSRWSEHSYGRAIDINPVQNPYVRGGTVLPPEGARYADRSLDVPGMIHAGDVVVEAFAERGWIWAGTWSGTKDYQHFSTTGR